MLYKHYIQPKSIHVPNKFKMIPNRLTLA